MAVVEDALSRILDAHGGLDYWNSLSSIDIEMSAGGFLFTTKRIAPVRHARLTLNTKAPEVVTHDFPAPGHSTLLHGGERIEIRDAGGSVIESRTDPRGAFNWRRKLLYWDTMDFAYFSSYAMWNYLCLPFLLTYPGMSVSQVGRDCMTVGFPAGLPTHSPVQRLYFDESGLLTGHDYTAEVVGGWAKAAHLISEYRRFGGLMVPTVRRVYPRGPFGRPLPGPTLVAVDVHDVRLNPAG